MRTSIRICSQFVCFVLIFSLCLTVSAHSGRTDSRGGHTNHSTGDYHYHHGYSAHDHYDMDGDGEVDCPYDFDDKTEPNSGSNYSFSYDSDPFIPRNDPVAETVVTTKTVSERVPNTPSWICWIIGLLVIDVVIFLIIILQQKKQIAKEHEVHRKALLDEKERYDNKLSEIQTFHAKELQEQSNIFNYKLDEYSNEVTQELSFFVADIAFLLGPNYLYKIAGAPHDASVDEHSLPRSGDCNTHKWGSEYTFYSTFRSTKSTATYHRIGCRYCKHGTPTNAYSIKSSPDKYKSCAVCKPDLPLVHWVDRYIEFKQFLDKYMGELPDIQYLDDISN